MSGDIANDLRYIKDTSYWPKELKERIIRDPCWKNEEEKMYVKIYLAIRHCYHGENMRDFILSTFCNHGDRYVVPNTNLLYLILRDIGELDQRDRLMVDKNVAMQFASKIISSMTNLNLIGDDINPEDPLSVLMILSENTGQGDRKIRHNTILYNVIE
jgi:hypothetical protein